MTTTTGAAPMSAAELPKGAREPRDVLTWIDSAANYIGAPHRLPDLAEKLRQVSRYVSAMAEREAALIAERDAVVECKNIDIRARDESIRGWAERARKAESERAALVKEVEALRAEQDALKSIPPPPDGFRYVAGGGRTEVFDVASWPDHAGIWRDDDTGLPVLNAHGELKDWPTGHFHVVLVQVQAIDAARAEARDG